MKHHTYNQNFKFFKEPVEFNKYTNKDLLRYCIGGLLYMPATQNNILEKIKNKNIPGMTSMTMCFEDAIPEDKVPEAEENVISILDELYECLEDGRLTQNDLPLFFLRVRNPKHFKSFSEKLKPEHTRILTGFIFPKFCTANGYLYMEQLDYLNNKLGDIIYGMPILESEEVIYKETRLHELIGIKNLLKPYNKLILNIRVGAADFSSKFGVRRGVDYTIYDIMTVSDCLKDILNFFNRESEDYVVSAPVWEYFSNENYNCLATQTPFNIHNFVMRRKHMINEAIDGLLREVALDKANGFVGKTIIHPMHLKYVNAMQAVTKEEYEDALQILQGTTTGVKKGKGKNGKMNEMSPHRYWAKTINYKAQAYGVIDDDTTYVKLFLADEKVRDAQEVHDKLLEKVKEDNTSEK